MEQLKKKGFSGCGMQGFSTLEILIAMTIMISTLTAVLLVSFGNQSLLEQGGMNAEALQKAQVLLEIEQANAHKDFRMVSNIATTSDGVYEQSLSVADVVTDPYTTKHVTAVVTWKDERNTVRSVKLTELLSDFQDPTTLDTCDAALSGNWKLPTKKEYVLAAGGLLPSTAPSGHSFSATNPISSVDAYQGRLYMGVSKKAAASNDSLFIFDSRDPSHKPVYLGSSNNNASVTEGVNAIIVAGTYLYAANTHVSNFKTCKPSANCSQLQIVNITNPGVIPAPINFLIPTSSAPFVTGTSTLQALGNSIFYQNGYVFMGLSKTATGPEFNIIDVHDPNNPHWIGGYQVGSSINQIYVRGSHAYLATDNKLRELIVLDINNLVNPTLVSTFDPTGTPGFEVGKSLYMRGNDLYFGMSSATGSPELYLLNGANTSAFPVISSRIIGSSILGMFVRNSILFMLASTIQQLQMFDVSNSASSTPYTIPIRLPGAGSALDCEGNYFFASSNNGSQGNLSIIGAQ
jgi:hypothetical protein